MPSCLVLLPASAPGTKCLEALGLPAGCYGMARCGKGDTVALVGKPQQEVADQNAPTRTQHNAAPKDSLAARVSWRTLLSHAALQARTAHAVVLPRVLSSSVIRCLSRAPSSVACCMRYLPTPQAGTPYRAIVVPPPPLSPLRHCDEHLSPTHLCLPRPRIDAKDKHSST